MTHRLQAGLAWVYNKDLHPQEAGVLLTLLETPRSSDAITACFENRPKSTVLNILRRLELKEAVLKVRAKDGSVLWSIVE
jgi:hypothetical protein